MNKMANLRRKQRSFGQHNLIYPSPCEFMRKLVEINQKATLWMKKLIFLSLFNTTPLKPVIFFVPSQTELSGIRLASSNIKGIQKAHPFPVHHILYPRLFDEKSRLIFSSLSNSDGFILLRSSVRLIDRRSFCLYRSISGRDFRSFNIIYSRLEGLYFFSKSFRNGCVIVLRYVSLLGGFSKIEHFYLR